MDALEVLKKGMKLEREGLEFYLGAAECSADPETAQLFRDLAADEVDHYNAIGRQYDALAAGKAWVPIPELETVEPIDVQAPIFPPGLMACEILPDRPSDEDALLFALGVEVKSFELYSQSAREVDNADARRLFQALAAAEQQHFNLLMARYEARFAYPR
ncbi:MAG: ferritin family protein [Anaerolineae bacterium]|nr:ferritin family protein [Anaerolineae bacterium]